MLSELSERQCAYVGRFPPYYISSIGCHLLNIENKQRQFYYHSGQLFDFRTHCFMIAPSGFSKTFFLDHFLDEDCGMISGSSIKTAFEGYMTEAGWVGQVKWSSEGTAEEKKGAAWEYRHAIIGVEEFSAIIEAMKASHSRQLDVAMLTSLDRGRVRKRVGPGSLKYTTQVSLWSGTQTMRLDLASGMGRRLLFMVFFPTEADKRLLREMYLKGHNIRFNPFKVRKIRDLMEKKRDKIRKIQEIVIPNEVGEFIRHKRIIHYEIPIYERLLAGYSLMSQPVKRTLVLKFDKEALRLVNQELHWRTQIKRGGRIAQVITIIREHSNSLHINQLRDELVDFGLDWKQSSELIQGMVKSRIIKIDAKGTITLWRMKR